ncbi:MAG: hypothetical protein IKT87_09235 [Bacteroidaceae bacterium]|jgi:hypothetical protein|nr:hypothetical protein [Bacteroidaceae bacterium]
MSERIRLLFKLLRQNISLWQTVGFVIANLIGGAIVLVGIQAYQDFDRFVKKENGLLSEGYVVVTKPVNTLSTISSLVGMKPVFRTNEIEELRQHPNVSDVGVFSSANFRIRGSFSLGDLGISTDLFMESVPDRFIDVKFDSPSDWHASVDGNFVPVIIPRKYLNIYNYGYAATKGLPQLAEGLTSAFPIMMNVAGNGHRQSYNARIVGYTDRLNTILVPESFLKEANDRFATTSNEAPSRLIVTVNSDKGKNDFLDFLAQKGYRIEGDTESLKLQTLVNGILWVVIGIGGIVSILAFSLLLISILLLIEKNREKFVNLYSMGYSVPQIARPYTILVAMVDGIVWLIAIALVSLAYPRLFAFISVISPDLQLASLLPLWLVAVAFAVVFILFHRWMIIRQLRKICE